MPKETIQFEHSPAFLLLSLLISATLAYLLYGKSEPWGGKLRIALYSFRFLLLFIISLLLIGPIIKHVLNTFEKPTIVIGIDNSMSMQLATDSSSLGLLTEQIISLENKLVDQDFIVEKKSLDYNIVNSNDVLFNAQNTDINGFLNKLESDYERRNLAGAVLFTDGIYNQGVSPVYKSRTFPIYSIGIGDTIPKKDIYVNFIKHNKISYQGNKFPIQVEIGNTGYGGEEVKVSVIHAGRELDNSAIILNPSEQNTLVVFEIEADKKGMQRYSIRLNEKSGESNFTNNQADAYIDIVEGKERILIAATSPHPDIAAIKSAITQNANYEVVTHIAGINDEPDGKFDLVIYHQFPDRRSTLMPLFDKYSKDNIPFWIIMGQNARIDVLNNVLPFATIRSLGGEGDEITAVYNTAFTRFDFSDEVKTMLSDAPPLKVPFLRVTTSAQPMLYQRLGSVETKNPLLIVNDEENSKGALMLGDGLWKWKFYEYAKTENNKGFNELILKTVQYLSTRQDKRKFKLTPLKKEINLSESLVLESEVYNHLYERIYGQNIKIELTNEDNETLNYSFVNSENNGRYRISSLKKGVYRYKAYTTIDSKVESFQGEFIVRDVNIESLNLTANFDLLRTISNQSGGQFFTIDSSDQLQTVLANKNISSIIHSDEVYLPMINLKWVFFLILILASSEWFTRKYNGQY